MFFALIFVEIKGLPATYSQLIHYLFTGYLSIESILFYQVNEIIHKSNCNAIINYQNYLVPVRPAWMCSTKTGWWRGRVSQSLSGRLRGTMPVVPRFKRWKNQIPEGMAKLPP